VSGYLAVRFDCGASDADAWSDALLAAGALSVEVSDPYAGSSGETPVFAEPGAGEAALWPISRVVALCASDADAAAMMREASRIVGQTAPPHEVSRVDERDWVRVSQTQFGPIEVANDLWIVPSWCEPPRPGALNITLDPGLAFGTGSHATTRLCLKWLAAEIRGGESVLDYGCGSGILAIAAARLGAASVTGVDVDPQALSTSRDNARANGVNATFVEPDALPSGAFDIVVANILANPLRLLAPAMAGRVRAAGRLALAGILTPQVDEIAVAYERWFNIAPWGETDGWTLVAGVRRSGA
jgi:ribosomal protein L11 methyltransferase